MKPKLLIGTDRWTPDKLHGSPPSATKKDPSVALRKPSVTLKISRKWWMSSKQRISLRISTIRGKLFPYYIYIYIYTYTYT